MIGHELRRSLETRQTRKPTRTITSYPTERCSGKRHHALEGWLQGIGCWVVETRLKDQHVTIALIL
jgi:hypothetical protein